MKRFLLALIALLLGAARPTLAQDATNFLLTRANNLRAAQGLPAYALHPALTAAAGDHARWMAENNRLDHFQSDGSGVRTRAPKAGFPSSWVGENIYLGSGASPNAAWNWWLNSPVHYAGLVSPNYDKIGIGSATAAGRTAFVVVFGNSQGRLPQAAAGGASSGASSGGESAPVRQQSFVLGLDEFGNIKHEVQPGHTMGDIALIYGYTWDDIPAMLALNGMTQDDIRYLQPGEVFLVPPKAGTFTPTSEAPASTATATATMTPLSTPTLAASAATPDPTSSSTHTLRINLARAEAATPLPDAGRVRVTAGRSLARLLPLGAAIMIQLGIIGAASLELLRRSS